MATKTALELKAALSADGWNVQGVTLLDLAVFIHCRKSAAAEFLRDGSNAETVAACYRPAHETRLYRERGAVYCAAVALLA